MSVMTDDDRDSPRRRQPSADVTVGRTAAALVRDLNRQLGHWQATSVKIHTIAERLKAAGRTDPSVAEEAKALFRVVSAEAERFQLLLPAQTESVVQHGRIRDTKRSFEMVADRLKASLKLLGDDHGAN